MQVGILTNGKRLRTVVVCHPNGREHLLTWAVPDPNLTVDEIAGLNAGNIVYKISEGVSMIELSEPFDLKTHQ